MQNNSYKFNSKSDKQDELNSFLLEEIVNQGSQIEKFQKETKKIMSFQEAIRDLIYGKTDKNTNEKIDKGLIEENLLMKEQLKDFKASKIDFITVGGIFVSIFTFISIEIQILRYVCDFWRIAGFSLIMIGGLSSFALLIQYLGRVMTSTSSEHKFPTKIFFWLCAFPFVVGLASPFGNKLAPQESCIINEENINDIKNRITNLEKNSSINTYNENAKNPEESKTQ